MIAAIYLIFILIIIIIIYQISKWSKIKIINKKILLFIYERIKDTSISNDAAAISFNFFTSIIPGIIFIFSLIAYIPIEGFHKELMDFISGLIPKSTNEFIYNAIEDIISKQRIGLLSIGFISCIYFSSNGINSLIKSFERMENKTTNQNAIKRRTTSILLTSILFLLLLIFILFMIMLKKTIALSVELNMLKNNIMPVFYSIKWISIYALLQISYYLIFLFGTYNIKYNHYINIGSFFSATLTILTSIFLDFFIKKFSIYNLFLESIGAILIILIWIYFISIFTLWGFKLNQSIHKTNL